MVTSFDDFINWVSFKEPSLTESSVRTLEFYYNECVNANDYYRRNFPKTWRVYLYNKTLHEAICNATYYPTDGDGSVGTELQLLFVGYGVANYEFGIQSSSSTKGTSTGFTLPERLLTASDAKTSVNSSTPYGREVERIEDEIPLII